MNAPSGQSGAARHAAPAHPPTSSPPTSSPPTHPPASSPANSTPVGPPPTTTMCSRRSRSSGLRPAAEQRRRERERGQVSSCWVAAGHGRPSTASTPSFNQSRPPGMLALLHDATRSARIVVECAASLRMRRVLNLGFISHGRSAAGQAASVCGPLQKRAAAVQQPSTTHARSQPARTRRPLAGQAQHAHRRKWVYCSTPGMPNVLPWLPVEMAS